MMKKLTLVLLLLTLGYGCTQDQYALEKEYWHLRKKAQSILQNPHGAPPVQFQKAISGLKEFMEAHPLSPQRIEAESFIGKLYIAAGAYGKGRQALEELLERFPGEKKLGAETLYLIGTSYEKEKEWERAEEYYTRVINAYPETEQGIMLPMYIAEYYKRKPDTLKMQEWYRTAVTHYRTLTQKNLGTETAFRADMLTAKAYSELGEWKDALQTLEMIIYEYKDTMDVEGALINKVIIYSRDFKDEVKAREALMELAEFYPDSKFLRFSDQQLLLKGLQTE